MPEAPSRVVSITQSCIVLQGQVLVVRQVYLLTINHAHANFDMREL